MIAEEVSLRSRVRGILAAFPFLLLITVLIAVDLFCTGVLVSLSLLSEETTVLIITIISWVILACFVFEILVKLLVFGASFFSDWMDIADMLVVMASVVAEVATILLVNAKLAKLVVLLRLLRLIRVGLLTFTSVRRIHHTHTTHEQADINKKLVIAAVNALYGVPDMNLSQAAVVSHAIDLLMANGALGADGAGAGLSTAAAAGGNRELRTFLGSYGMPLAPSFGGGASQLGSESGSEVSEYGRDGRRVKDVGSVSTRSGADRSPSRAVALHTASPVGELYGRPLGADLAASGGSLCGNGTGGGASSVAGWVVVPESEGGSVMGWGGGVGVGPGPSDGEGSGEAQRSSDAAADVDAAVSGRSVGSSGGLSSGNTMRGTAPLTIPPPAVPLLDGESGLSFGAEPPSSSAAWSLAVREESSTAVAEAPAFEAAEGAVQRASGVGSGSASVTRSPPVDVSSEAAGATKRVAMIAVTSAAGPLAPPTPPGARPLSPWGGGSANGALSPHSTAMQSVVAARSVTRRRLSTASGVSQAGPPRMPKEGVAAARLRAALTAITCPVPINPFWAGVRTPSGLEELCGRELSAISFFGFDIFQVERVAYTTAPPVALPASAVASGAHIPQDVVSAATPAVKSTAVRAPAALHSPTASQTMTRGRSVSAASPHAAASADGSLAAGLQQARVRMSVAADPVQVVVPYANAMAPIALRILSLWWAGDPIGNGYWGQTTASPCLAKTPDNGPPSSGDPGGGVRSGSMASGGWFERVGDGPVRCGGRVGSVPIDWGKVPRFVAAVCALYRTTVPFHDATHAADVMQATHALLCCGSPPLAWRFDRVEILAMLLAALLHDLDHPGVSNAFLTRTGDTLAVLHNDRAPCENHHLVVAFEVVLKHPQCDIFGTLPTAEKARIRSLIINFVLGTDMAFHYDHLAAWSARLSTLGSTRRSVYAPLAESVAAAVSGRVPQHTSPSTDASDGFVVTARGRVEAPLSLTVSGGPVQLGSLAGLLMALGELRSTCAKAHGGGIGGHSQQRVPPPPSQELGFVPHVSLLQGWPSRLLKALEHGAPALRSLPVTPKTLTGVSGSLKLTEGVSLDGLMIVHTADLSNPLRRARGGGAYLQWVQRVLTEFFAQGRLETSLGLPVSPMMGEEETVVARSQRGFIDFIVRPTVTAMCRFISPFEDAAIEAAASALAQHGSVQGAAAVASGGAGSGQPGGGALAISAIESVELARSSIVAAEQLPPSAPLSDAPMALLYALAANRDGFGEDRIANLSQLGTVVGALSSVWVPEGLVDGGVDGRLAQLVVAQYAHNAPKTSR